MKNVIEILPGFFSPIGNFLETLGEHAERIFNPILSAANAENMIGPACIIISASLLMMSPLFEYKPNDEKKYTGEEYTIHSTEVTTADRSQLVPDGLKKWREQQQHRHP